jgi:hypothetical protein
LMCNLCNEFLPSSVNLICNCIKPHQCHIISLSLYRLNYALMKP